VTCTRAKGTDAKQAARSPTTLGNVLSALEFHTIAAIFIFEFFGSSEDAHDWRLRHGEISAMKR
jgi:hypothetical protein